MKIRYLLTSMLLPLTMMSSTSSIPTSKSVSRKFAVKRNLGATLDGFDLETETPLMTPINNASGYVHAQSWIYSLKLNSISSLVLVQTSISFTPGYVAAFNDEKGFDASSLLTRGYIHFSFGRFYCNDAHGDEVEHIAAFPRKKEENSTTISESFGGSVSIGKTFSDQLSISDNSSLTIQNTTSGGLSYSYQKEISTSAADPFITYQQDSQGKNQEWNIEVLNSNITGKATYWFDCINLLKVKNEDIDSVPNNSFEMDASFKMVTTTATTRVPESIFYQYF